MTVLQVRLACDGGPAALEEIADILERTADPIAIVDATLLIPRAALAPILDDPTAATAMLVRPTADGGDVRVRHHRVMGVGSAWHEIVVADHRWLGAVLIAPGDANSAAGAFRTMARAWRDGRLGPDQGSLDAVQLCAVALVRGGVACRAVTCVDVPWSRGARSNVELATTRAAVEAFPAERIERLQANRVDDGFYSTFVVRRASKPLTRLALRLGWSPNTITLISFAVGLGAAVLFAIGLRWSLVLGALALQLSLVIDCVDGEVARATRRFTALGAWLDAWTDRVKEFCAYAGLAWGSAVALGVDAWPVAVLLVVLQTTRHVSDYDFSRVQWQRETAVPERAMDDPADLVEGWASGSALAGAMAKSTQANRRSSVRWFKRAIHLPIGERWLIISVVAALASGAWALRVLFIAGLLALAYVMAGRILRTVTWRGSAPDDAVLLLARQSDGGPLVSTVARWVPLTRLWRGRWSWVVPAALRLVELGLVALLVLAVVPGARAVAPLAFAWVAVVAFHHYDVLYRALGGASMPRWLTWAGLGWDGRSLAVIAASALGLAALTDVLGVGAGILAAIVVVIASAQWLLSQRTRPDRMSA